MRLTPLAIIACLLWTGAACAQDANPPVGGDPDHDFVLTEDQAFAVADTNHDDAVTLQEARQFQAARWKRLDPGQSGVISVDPHHLDALSTNILGGAPVSADGKITRTAFDHYWIDRFHMSDLHHDGALDSVEFHIYVGGSLGDYTGPVPPPPTYSLLAAPFASGLPKCEDLGRDPRFGLIGAQGVSKVSVTKVAATNTAAAYCDIELTYNSGKAGPKDGYDDGQPQAIGIRIGLPLRPDDGGKVAWNGRIQNLGSGGCMGFMAYVTPATNSGFVGSANDGGHRAKTPGFDCSFGVIPAKHAPNKGLIRDFSDNVIWQTQWAKTLTRTYYGQPAKRTYWAGCSQGGRQAAAILQLIPNEYDGVLGGGAALDWMRLPIAQAWPGLVIKDMLRFNGKDLTPAEIAQTVKLETRACDAHDGVTDGVLGDPRQCHWSAKAAICGAPGAAAQNCLDSDQAAAFDAIRQGPVNHLGQRISFPWEPGTIVSNGVNYFAVDPILQWAFGDLLFISDAHLYMDRAALVRAKDPDGITAEDMVTLSSQTVGDLAETGRIELDAAAKSGVKAMLWTGTRDKNIPSRITLKYYRDVAAHLGMSVSDPRFQKWFRVFLYPGVAHCGGEDAPQPGDRNTGPLFQALVAWVEQGKAPERIIATKVAPDSAHGPGSGGDHHGLVTRPVCAYPKTAIYKGSGSTDDAANFSCGGNLETQEIVEQGLVIDPAKANGTGVVPHPYGPAPAPN